MQNKTKRKLKHAPHLQFKGFLVANNIRQNEVAEMLNISPVTLSHKINGHLHFTFSEIEKICDEYGVMPDLFLTQKVEQ